MPFTESERNRIDTFHKNNFANMAPDDVQLYGRWCAENAATQRENELRDDAVIQELHARGEMYHEQAALAKAEFDEHLNRILARERERD